MKFKTSIYICTCSTLLVVEWAGRAWLGVFALGSSTFGAVWWGRIKPNPTTGWIHCTRVLAISQRKKTGPIGIACHHFCPMIYKCCCTSCWNFPENIYFDVWNNFFSIYNVIVTINHVIKKAIQNPRCIEFRYKSITFKVFFSRIIMSDFF